jgi:TonB C terminal
MTKVRRRIVGVLGASSSVLLHSLLFVALLWGDGAPPRGQRVPDAVGAAANTGVSGGSSTDRLIMIQLMSEVGDHFEEPIEQSEPLLQVVAEPKMLEITGPDSLPMDPLFPSSDENAQDATEVDLVARTKLVGLYEGQIRARIERAWSRPDDQLPEGSFNCRIKVDQDRRGNVTHVELVRCNGTERWQSSLRTAVLAASPLPAPPNDNLYVDAFSLMFNALSLNP